MQFTTFQLLSVASVVMSQQLPPVPAVPNVAAGVTSGPNSGSTNMLGQSASGSFNGQVQAGGSTSGQTGQYGIMGTSGQATVDGQTISASGPPPSAANNYNDPFITSGYINPNGGAAIVQQDGTVTGPNGNYAAGSQMGIVNVSPNGNVAGYNAADGYAGVNAFGLNAKVGGAIQNAACANIPTMTLQSAYSRQNGFACADYGTVRICDNGASTIQFNNGVCSAYYPSDGGWQWRAATNGPSSGSGGQPGNGQGLCRIGDPCYNNNDCQSGFCSNGKCAASTGTTTLINKPTNTPPKSSDATHVAAGLMSVLAVFTAML